MTPDGSLLYVANHTEGTVSILVIASNPLAPILDGSVQVGGNPMAIAITDAGPSNVTTVFVTQMFAELNPDFHDPAFGGNGEGAISVNKESSKPSRPAMRIRRSPKSF